MIPAKNKSPVGCLNAKNVNTSHLAVYPYGRRGMTLSAGASGRPPEVSQTASMPELSPEAAYLRYRARALYSAYALLGNMEDAMEMVHEAFLRAFRHWDRFDPERDFYPWFHRILRNLCFNQMRSRKRSPVKQSLEDLQEQGIAIPTGMEGPLDTATQNERAVRMGKAIMGLSQDDREIILLREFHGLSYKDIAEAIGCPIGTVMSRLHTARTRLRAALEDLGITL